MINPLLMAIINTASSFMLVVIASSYTMAWNFSEKPRSNSVLALSLFFSISSVLSVMNTVSLWMYIADPKGNVVLPFLEVRLIVYFISLVYLFKVIWTKQKS